MLLSSPVPALLRQAAQIGSEKLNFYMITSRFAICSEAMTRNTFMVPWGEINQKAVFSVKDTGKVGKKDFVCVQICSKQVWFLSM